MRRDLKPDVANQVNRAHALLSAECSPLTEEDKQVVCEHGIAVSVALAALDLEQQRLAIDWPAAGLMGTEIRCFMELEVQHGTKEVYP